MRKTSTLILILFAPYLMAQIPAGAHHALFGSGAQYTTFALMPEIASQNEQPQILMNAPRQEPTKNRGKAFFMSLLIPGWGQHYAGATLKRNVFVGIELGLWLSYGSFKTFSSWRQQDYETYAATHAGVNLEGKNNTYFIDVGNFSSIFEHNEYRLQQRNFSKYYQDIDFYYWQWESEAHRDKFDRLRISADTADNRALFTLGAIVANHVVSAIDAVWSVHRLEKSKLSNLDFDVQFGDGYIQPIVNVFLTAQF